MSADPSVPHVSKSLRGLARGLASSYPSIIQSLGQQILPAAEYEQAAQEAIAPREAALSSSIYAQNAPIYSQAAAGADLAALQGAGGASVRAADSLNREIDPEFYATRSGAADKLNALLGGMDPNSLTGAELENVARGLARSRGGGGVGVPSNSSAIRNALTYGNALNQKRSGVAQAINVASGALPQFRSGIDVFGQATGRTGTSAFGGGFNANTEATSDASTTGQNLLGQGATLQGQRLELNQARRDQLDRAHEGLSSTICCFIFLEAYNGKLPEYVRIMRDYWYNQEPALSVGYKKMAKWLVPWMRKSSLVAKAVNLFMVKPMSRMGLYHTNQVKSYSLWDRWVFDFWFSVWRNYAKI